MKLTATIALDSGLKMIDKDECFRSLPNSSLFLFARLLSLFIAVGRRTRKKKNMEREHAR